MTRDKVFCATECQYAKDVAMAEHHCAIECQYEVRARADLVEKRRRRRDARVDWSLAILFGMLASIMMIWFLMALGAFR